MNIGSFISNTGKNISKHSPEILTVLGITGGIVSVALACTATEKAIRTIDRVCVDNDTDYVEPKEKIKLTWKYYIPSAIVGGTSIACIIGAKHITDKRFTGLVTAYKISEAALIDFRNEVKESIGEKKAAAIQSKADEKTIKTAIEAPTNSLYIGDDTVIDMWDPYSNTKFRNKVENIRKIKNDMVDILQQEGEVDLNTYFCAADIGWNETGELLGWTNYTLTNCCSNIDVRFDSTMIEGRPFAVPRFTPAPAYISTN